MRGKSDLVFVHALQALGNRRDRNHGDFTADDWTVPQPAFQFCTFRKGQLGQEKCEDNKNFPEGDWLEQGSRDLSEPLCTCVRLTATLRKSIA